MKLYRAVGILLLVFGNFLLALGLGFAFQGKFDMGTFFAVMGMFCWQRYKDIGEA